MKRPWRVALKVSLLSILTGGLCYAGPGWAEEAGLDFWNYPHVKAALEAEVQRHKDLQQREEAIHHSLAIRTALTNDLLEGRISFDEAVAEFLAFNQADPSRCQAVELSFPAPTLQESARLQVLSFVRAQLGSTADSCEHLSAELRTEMQSYRSFGTHIH